MEEALRKKKEDEELRKQVEMAVRQGKSESVKDWMKRAEREDEERRKNPLLNEREMQKARQRELSASYKSPESYKEKPNQVYDTAVSMINMGKEAARTAGAVATQGLLTGEIKAGEMPSVFGSVFKEEMKSGAANIAEDKASEFLTNVLGRKKVKIRVSRGRR